AVTPSQGIEAKKRKTQPNRNTFSYQWAISISARARPENSVVMPRTSSWCAWCEHERSNGDLRNLITRVNRNPAKMPGNDQNSRVAWLAMAWTEKLRVTRYMPIAV